MNFHALTNSELPVQMLVKQGKNANRSKNHLTLAYSVEKKVRPEQSGIEASDVNPVFLDSGLRLNAGFWAELLVDCLPILTRSTTPCKFIGCIVQSSVESS